MTITSGNFFSLGFIGALLVALVPSVWALTPIEVAKLTAGDGGSEDYFEDSVAVDGDTALTSAQDDDDNGDNSGSAYVFSLNSETIAIGSFDINREESGEPAFLELYFTSDEEPFQYDMALLDLHGLTSTDIGKTFTFSSGTEFDKAVGYLTDGINGWVVWLVTAGSGGGGRGVLESSVFSGDVGAVNGFDFAGSTISSISVTLNGLEPFYATVDINSIPVPAAVTIDIKPGKEPNIINLKSGGFISVAILTEGEFDALQVDPNTSKFGPSEAIAERYKVKDVDRDGNVDLLLYFRIEQTGIVCSDTQATLVGELYDGSDITGTDSIKTVGCKPKKCHKKKHHNKHHGDDHHEGHEKR